MGMDTDHSLTAVLDKVVGECPHIDIVLATGDLSDQGAREAYDRLEAKLAPLPGEKYWLQGNHDDRAQMEAATGPGRLCGEIEVGAWQIIMLDSQIPGEVGGRLGAVELARLAKALQLGESRSLHSLICLHHQPVPIGCAWLDEQIVADAAAFWELVEQFTGVRGVLWGHVHQQIDTRRGDIALMSSPSTCVQFKPRSESFRVDNQSPGYRQLDLATDGTISTRVSRVDDVAFTVDLDSDGYL